ncbi:MAG: 16S rRNA (cytosine(1402)-N(4))-methyltransferase [Hyphomicrobium sp.]|nr:16S rRNA (cytosine(1402)-N(4))-methyltransferase [Hyphomicrobium sp.]PPD09413.1 MAG: 16S rRNA (cytosine(1402)-N(4))-methyltransferase [Hyphomicrobium sp.]
MSVGGGSTADTPRHIPVLLPDVLDALSPKAGETFIDGTFGAGGYTRAILEAGGTHVIAFDRDPTAIEAGAGLVAEFAPRLTLLHRPFGDMAAAIEESGVEAVDGAVLDIGVSSMQIDQAERGFSFQSDGPLDMRMSREGPSAADVVNGFDEEQIADIIYEYGEERRSRAIARAIVKARAVAPLTRTKELADLVLRVFHGRKEDGRHPATRTFQGLRIFVNDELGELERGLAGAEKILRPGGRLVVVTFHSLEDRIVKRFMAERSGKSDHGSRYLPQKNIQVSPPSFRIVNSRPLTPQKGELDVNPRARSARLRAAIRTDAPAWSTAGRS